ncbi:MAG: hypothetical protein WCI75_06475 [candidate division NC10 bacterium]
MDRIRGAKSRAGKGTIPSKTQAALRTSLERHAEQAWGDLCREVVVRFRGAFAYVDVFPRHRQFLPGETAEQQTLIEATPTHLCRLQYLGRHDLWGFAFYKYSDNKYEPSFLPSGAMGGTAEEAFDCAADVYLRD